MIINPSGTGTPSWGNGTCVGCSVPIASKAFRCPPCKVLETCAATKRYEEKNREHKRAVWRGYRRNLAAAAGRVVVTRRLKGEAPVGWRKPRLATPRKPRLVTAPRLPLLVYPFVRQARDEHAELLLVNTLVPRGLPGRDDVCQEIMIAIWEGRTTIEHLKQHGAGSLIRQFRRDNYESRGYAISLSEPRPGGGSWDDVLSADESGRAWA
jgi:hypothetical protein